MAETAFSERFGAYEQWANEQEQGRPPVQQTAAASRVEAAAAVAARSG